MINFPCKKQLVSLYYKLHYTLAAIKRKRYLKKVAKKEKINVVFFAANLAMWQYQHLYELMVKNNRFNISIIIAPFPYYTEDERNKNAEDLKKYFDNKNIKYIDCQSYTIDIEKELNPDILFYAQYYTHAYPQKYDAWYFRKRLLGAYPYGFKDCYIADSYNNPFHNVAWKLYYATNEDLKNAKESAFNKGNNVVVVGCPHADDFLSPEINDVWKRQDKKKKKVIYAPHHSIYDYSRLKFANFLIFSSFMQELAIKYSDKIQFAFKPHPLLITQLYKHKDWGKEKTDKYYEWWEMQENTQLETTAFIDLFKTSDAMIHDCSSFSIEYFYTQKPVMYLCQDIEEVKNKKNEVGKIAIDTHYIGQTKNDIISFIEEVVLKDIDPMKQQREKFFKKYLLPPNGKTVAQNTMDDILKSLNIQ